MHKHQRLFNFNLFQMAELGVIPSFTESRGGTLVVIW